MPRISEIATAKGTQFRKVMAHRPEILAGWSSLDELIRFGGVLPPLLKEEVRRALAQHSGCAFCASLGQPSDQHDDATAAAVRFALALAASPSSVSNDEFDRLRDHFSDAQIVELTAWITFMFASEMLGAVIKLDAASDEQLQGYNAWLQAGFAKYERTRAAAATA